MGLKSSTTAALLAMFLGPFGMLYTSFGATLVFGFVDMLLVANQSSWVFLSWLVGIGCNVWMAKEHNQKIEDTLTRAARAAALK